MIGGWVDPMTFAFDVAGTSSIIFFVIVVAVGFFIIMNLFVSILLEVRPQYPLCVYLLCAYLLCVYLLCVYLLCVYLPSFPSCSRCATP